MERYLECLPTLNWTTIILLIYIIVVAFGYLLEYLNLSYMKKFGSSIPPAFEGAIDQSILKKTQGYIIENTQFGFISSIFNNIILIIFLFGGILDAYNSWIVSINLSFICSGLLFFILIYYAETILTIPFDLYRTFKIERKYGFCTMTPGLWITDFMKSFLISTILMSLIISAGLYIYKKSPGLWWFWLWFFFLIFGIFIMYISPYLIEPFFNKFTPIQDETLKGKIRNLMQKVGIKVGRVLKMDASKRTKHTNAYFTGIGRVKRIVLFDTLIDKMGDNEILSVLAHEVGHWKKRHLLKHIIATECIGLIVIYLSFKILEYDLLINLFNIKDSTIFAKIIILGFLGSIAAFPLTAISNYISRRHEIEADRIAYKLTGNARSIITALVKLSKDNLSNLYPHPVYVALYYSHPPILERIRFIDEMDARQKSNEII